jgi:hypothetical protein
VLGLVISKLRVLTEERIQVEQQIQAGVAAADLEMPNDFLAQLSHQTLEALWVLGRVTV